MATSSARLAAPAHQPAHAAATDQSDVRIEYRISLPAPHTKTVNIELYIAGLNSEAETLELHLPTWRPGRYEVLDLAGTIRRMVAFDEDGAPISMEKFRKSSWRVHTAGSQSVRIAYTIFADALGNRTRHVDDTHAFLSGTSVFLYAEMFRDYPCIVRVQAPDGWQVATGLEPVENDPFVRIAPNYDVLVDSPLEIGMHETITFDALDVPHEIVLSGYYDTINREHLIEDFRSIVELQAEIFGELPYERYVFLTHVGRGAGGGTEHLNSTIMQTSTGALEGSTNRSRAYQRFLSLVSHEVFHTWNVKQFRPLGILHYDYLRENYTRLFWVVEGTTSYYDDLTLVRAGLINTQRYFDGLASSHASIRSRPGAAVQSLEESSFDAWIKFNKPTADSSNTTVSFYSKGALVSLMLDLEIRRRSHNNHSLDDMMRILYEQFPLGERGYTPEDIVQIAEDLAGSDLTSFFDQYVRGTAPLDLPDALLAAGLELKFQYNQSSTSEEDADDGDGDSDDAEDETQAQTTEPVRKAYLGVTLSGQRIRTIREGSPAWRAGLMLNDESVAVDGERLRGSIDDQIATLQPGDPVTITYFRRDELREKTITLGGQEDGRWVLRRIDEPSDLQRDIYESWLGQSWPQD